MDSRESAEMYLETIYILSQKSEAVRKIDVSRYMGYAKPSVTRAIGLLENRGLVSVEENGVLQLTQAGKVQAQQIYERHTVLTKMFVNLGVDESVAAEDACRIEHYISETTFDAIKKHMEKYESP